MVALFLNCKAIEHMKLTEVTASWKNVAVGFDTPCIKQIMRNNNKVIFLFLHSYPV